MEERRCEPRLRSLLGGQISFDDRLSAMSCTVRNVSPGGAMVIFSDMFRLPKDFSLSIPRHEETRQATVIWRRNDCAGVSLAPVESAVEYGMAPRKMWLQGARRAQKRGMVVGY